MPNHPDTIESRVSYWLESLGFGHLQVTDLGEGAVRLSGVIESVDDQAFVMAIARTVDGVTEVVPEFSAS